MECSVNSFIFLHPHLSFYSHLPFSSRNAMDNPSKNAQTWSVACKLSTFVVTKLLSRTSWQISLLVCCHVLCLVFHSRKSSLKRHCSVSFCYDGKHPIDLLLIPKTSLDWSKSWTNLLWESMLLLEKMSPVSTIFFIEVLDWRLRFNFMPTNFFLQVPHFTCSWRLDLYIGLQCVMFGSFPRFHFIAMLGCKGQPRSAS